MSATAAVIVTAGALALLGSPAGNAATGAPQERGTQKWQQAIEKLRVPGKGCFTASYPKVAWVKGTCKKAPHRPYPPVHGHRPQVVGNGTDYSAEVTGLLTSAVGTFDYVSPGATETGQQNGAGPQVANTYSLQLNAKPFTTSKCAGSPNPGCLGWQQFIYSTTYNQVFMQYWLLKYNTTCPGGWGTFTFPPPSTDIYCYTNSTASTLTGGPPAVASLAGVTLTGSAAGGGNDSVVMTTGAGTATATAADSVLHLASGWKGVEFAIVGDCCGTQANFSPGTVLHVRTTTHSGTTAAPMCVMEGFTGETNNLNLSGAPAIGVSPAPAIVSSQTYAPGVASCATASGVGDTHLATFRSMLYDFQASGDFELATTGPQFVVENRQVSGAPSWPNAAVNQGIGAHVGKTDVALCLAPATVAPGVELFVNKKPVPLASGGQLDFSDGGDVSRSGEVYLIRGADGDSVQAQVNFGNPDWINVAVGLGRWPETVHGLLANAGTNNHALASRGGTVLTAPFSFGQFYHLYGDSWRVPASKSLLSVCGQTGAGDPASLMYASNLDPQTARAARAVCVEAGVKVAALLDACTVDVAVLGPKNAAAIYRTLPTNLFWGKITIPPFAARH